MAKKTKIETEILLDYCQQTRYSRRATKLYAQLRIPAYYLYVLYCFTFSTPFLYNVRPCTAIAYIVHSPVPAWLYRAYILLCSIELTLV